MIDDRLDEEARARVLAALQNSPQHRLRWWVKVTGISELDFRALRAGKAYPEEYEEKLILYAAQEPTLAEELAVRPQPTAEQIGALRAALGLTVREFMARFQVTPSQYYVWLAGRHQMAPRRLRWFWWQWTLAKLPYDGSAAPA